MGIRHHLKILRRGRSGLQLLREPFLAKHRSQSARDRPSADSVEGAKLNLGSGHDNKPGWVNIDLHARHSPDIVADVTRLVTLEDKSAGYALAQDILEHLSRNTVLTALHEWNRVLRDGGLLELRTTDVIAIDDLMRRPGMRRPGRNNPASHDRLPQCLFGTQGYVGDFHLSGFTETWMRHALEKTGFEVVYFGRRDGWLLDVVARKVRHSPPDRLITDGTDEEFIDAAYRTLLHREPDDEGRAYWPNTLNADRGIQS